MNNSIKVFAPATISNVGCGFDTMGFALEKPGDIVSIKLSQHGEVRIKRITGDGKALPSDIKKNTASVAILELLNHYKHACNLLTFDMPLPFSAILNQRTVISRRS